MVRTSNKTWEPIGSLDMLSLPNLRFDAFYSPWICAHLSEPCWWQKKWFSTNLTCYLQRYGSPPLDTHCRRVWSFFMRASDPDEGLVFLYFLLHSFISSSCLLSTTICNQQPVLLHLNGMFLKYTVLKFKLCFEPIIEGNAFMLSVSSLDISTLL